MIAVGFDSFFEHGGVLGWVLWANAAMDDLSVAIDEDIGWPLIDFIFLSDFAVFVDIDKDGDVIIVNGFDDIVGFEGPLFEESTRRAVIAGEMEQHGDVVFLT